MRAAVTAYRLEAIAGVPMGIYTAPTVIAPDSPVTVVVVGAFDGLAGGRQNLVHADKAVDDTRYMQEFIVPMNGTAMSVNSLPTSTALLVRKSAPVVGGRVSTDIAQQIGIGRPYYTTNYSWRLAFAAAVYPGVVTPAQTLAIMRWLAGRYQIAI